MTATYREVPDSAVEVMERFEGCSLIAYDDKQPRKRAWKSVAEVRGVPTIGIGHTRTVTKEDVIKGRRITRAEAERLKKLDVAKAVKDLYSVLKPARIDALTEYQWGALISFAYNAGFSSKWKIARLINAGRLSEVPDQMILFVNSGGEFMQGLKNRRRAEIDLWRTAATAAHPVPVRGVEYAPAATPVEAEPGKPLGKSKTFVSSMLAGLSGVGTATTAAVGFISPHASASPALTTALTVFVVLGTVAAFLAAFFKAQDQQAGAA